MKEREGREAKKTSCSTADGDRSDNLESRLETDWECRREWKGLGSMTRVTGTGKSRLRFEWDPDGHLFGHVFPL